jgi:hypothetical protein
LVYDDNVACGAGAGAATGTCRLHTH